MLDVVAQSKQRHLLRLYLQGAQDRIVHFQSHCGLGLGTGFGGFFAQVGNGDLFELPLVAADVLRRVGMQCLRQLIFGIVTVDREVAHAQVGQQFTKIDVAAIVLNPHAALTHGAIAFLHVVFQAFGILLRFGCNPFAQDSRQDGEHKAKAEQGFDKAFGRHATGFHHCQFAVVGKARQGD